MRIVFVAGFLTTVLDELKKRMEAYLDNRSVVWVPQYRNGDLAINRFKGDFLHAVAGGAEEILVCLFVFRGQEEYLLPVLTAIIDEGKARSQGFNVRIEQTKNARDAEWVISQIEAFKPDGDREAPDELRQLESWVREKHASKITLHPRAVNAAKKSQYEDVQLVYAAIDLLATEYWTMRTAKPDCPTAHKGLCDAKLEELGLELLPAISPAQAGKEGDEYFVKYPPGSDKKRLLELHLKKGGDRDERNCLRIYFFWDDDAKRVVIGWLPSHLDTQGT